MTVNVTINNSIRSGHKKYLRLDDGLYSLRRLIEAAGAANAPQPAPLLNEHETGAINAFGMFWRRDEVNWEQARILGKQEGADKVVNFNDQIGIYLLHDRDRVIYIGRAEDALIKRLSAHTTGRFGGRWDRFSWFGLRAVQDNGSLKTGEVSWTRSDVIVTMEAVLIECLEPSQNRRRGDKLGDNEFLQERDPDFRRAEAKRLLDQLLVKAL